MMSAHSSVNKQSIASLCSPQSEPGAILANGCGGQETTLLSGQNDFFETKLVISCLQTYLTP